MRPIGSPADFGARMPRAASSTRFLVAAFLLAAALLLAAVACAVPDGGEDRATEAGADRASTARIVMVTHGQSADPFWSVVAKGAQDAGKELRVRVEYQAPGTFDMVEMSQFIDAAVASRPDGLAISIPDAEALHTSILAAVDARIPVVSLNSGAADFRALGIRSHVGQPERDAGYAAGRRFSADGARRVLCVNHEVGNVALDARCSGLEEGVSEAGGSAVVLAVSLSDPEDAQQRILGALGRDPTIDAVLALGPAGAIPALAALTSGVVPRDVRLGTFDLSGPVLEAIRDGNVSFAIDQQPYLQGYLAVVLLHKLAEIDAAPDGVIRTGPAFVSLENVEEVLRLVRLGVR